MKFDFKKFNIFKKIDFKKIDFKKIGSSLKKALIAVKDFIVKASVKLFELIKKGCSLCKKGIINLKDSIKAAIGRARAKKALAKEYPVEKKKLSEKQKKIIAICLGSIAGLILLLLLLLGIRSCAGNSKVRKEQQRIEQQMKLKENVMTSALNYAEKGEFDRALDKLDDYIDKYGEDPDVRDLINFIIDQKNAAKENGNGYDLQSLQNAMQDYRNSMQAALDRSNQQADDYKKQLEDLLKNQKNGSGNSGNGSANNSDSNGGSTYYYNNTNNSGSDRDALDAAAREAEAKRKAEEDELAKKNSALKKKIDALNDEIQKGKNDLNAGNTNGGISHFNKALTLIPEEAGKDYSADKKAEMATAYLDASEKSSNPQDKTKLMKEAVSMANNALQDNPSHAAAHYVLAKDALAKNDLNKALSEMQSAVKGAKADDPNLYLYYYELGKIQYRLKKFNEAATSFTKSCDLKSDFAPSRYNLGLTQKQLKNENAALAAFRKTIDIEPRHEKAFLEQGRILAGRNDLSGAIDAYRSVLAINSVNSQAAMELGSVYYKKQDYKNAEEMYRRAITMLSNGEELVLTKYNLSSVLFDAGKTSEALKYAKEAYDSKSQVKTNAAKANVVYNYALVLDSNGRSSEAIPLYKEALSFDANHMKSKINLAVMYMNLNPPETDAALNLLLQVYQKEPDNFEVNNNLGSAYLKIEDYSNAIRFFQNALKLDSKNNTVRENLAKAYASNKDFSNAQTMYEQVLKYDNQNWDAYIELAKVCIALEDNESADKYLQYVQDKNPSYRRNEVSNLITRNAK